MKRVNKCPASTDIEQLEKYLLQLEEIVKEIENSKKLPKNIKNKLLLYLTPLCGYETKKYNAMLEKINHINEVFIMSHNRITGQNSMINNNVSMCEQYVKIIRELINYTQKRVEKLNKLKKDYK